MIDLDWVSVHPDYVFEGMNPPGQDAATSASARHEP
jgi:hypothetical protein